MLPRFLGALAVSFLATVPVATAQCLDWAHGFGIPGNGADGDVYSFADFNDGSGLQLYVAGGFNNIGPYAIADLARWDGASWSAVPGGTFNQGVTALIVHDDGSGPALIVAGSFTQVGGVPMNNIAKWDGTSWSALGTGVNSYVQDLVVFDDGSGPALYASGGFSNAGATVVEHIAKWDGASWSDLDGGVPQGGVNAMAVFNDGGGARLFITGDFSAVGSSAMSASRIAAWDGDSWSSLGVGLSGGNPNGTCLAAHNDGSGPALYVGGQFNFAGGLPAINIARWNGTSFSALGDTPDDPIDCLVVCNLGTGPRLHAGGEFTSFGNIPAAHVARWNGVSWAALGAGLENAQSVIAMHASNVGSEQRLWVGGDFAKAGAMPSVNIARWGEPCTAPVFHSQPQNAVAMFGSPIVFSADVQATAPATYQWRRNAMPISNTASTWGADTSTLTINVWSISDEGDYDLVVTNSFGTVSSDIATLTVPVPGQGVPVTVEKVLYPPEPIENLPGSTWTSFSGPVESSTGDVQFQGKIDGIHSAIGLWQDGVANLVYKENDPAPATEAGTTFEQFNDRNVAANGQSVFNAELQGPSITSTNHEGIWYVDATATDLVARKGNQAAGAPAGSIYRTFTTYARIGDSGHVVFAADVFQGGTYLFTGVWRWDRANGAVLFAQTGTVAPGTTANFTGIGHHPAIDPNGTILFQASLDTITGFNYFGKDTGLWIGTPGAIQLIAKSGDLAPGIPAGTNLEYFKDNEFYLNALGEVAFGVRVAGASEYLKNSAFKWSGGSLEPIASYGQEAPGGPSGATFNTPVPRAMNESGGVLLHAHMQVSCFPCPNEGLWLHDSRDLVPIAFNESDPMPGAPTNFKLTSFEEMAVNDLNQVVFAADLTFGTSNDSVFGWTTSSGVFPIAVPGTQLEIGDEEFRTVDRAFLSSQDGGAEGWSSSSLKDDGTVYFHVNFTDATTGIYKAQFTTFLAAYFGPTTSYCTAGTSASGCQAIVSGTGFPSSTAPSGFELFAIDVEGDKDGLFFFGTNGQQANSWGNGTSYQCVVPPVSRAGVLSGSGTQDLCDGVLVQDFNALWCPTCPKPGKNPGAGATVQAQLWYRDPLNTSNQTTSMSSAVEFYVGP